MNNDRDTAKSHFWKAFLFGCRPSDFLLGSELADGIDTVIFNSGYEDWLKVMASLAGTQIK